LTLVASTPDCINFPTARPSLSSGRIVRNEQYREAATMNRILHVRQFFSDMISAADLGLFLGGAAVALLLSWLM
jgi:hypothetical protein